MDRFIVEAAAWALIDGDCRDAPPVEEQPLVIFERWRVYREPDGRQFLLGYNVQGRCGRATTAIVAIDSKSHVVTTSSGRQYQLRGPSGHCEAALLYWQLSARVQGPAIWDDVTDEIEQGLTRGGRA